MKKIILLIGMSVLVHLSYAQAFGEVDLITFETPDSLSYIENWPGNSFQTGIPAKVFFDSAWSAPNALVTDLQNPYPAGNLSAFTIKIYDPSWQWQFPGTSIKFYHKYDTDSLHDGGYIMLSADGGATWLNAVDAWPQNIFYYDPENNANPVIANGNAAYTGKSRMNNSTEYGWRTDEIRFCFYNTEQKVYLRFVFSSDSIPSNKEGWMIDNILLMQEVCEGIGEMRNDNLITVSPNPASDQLIISEEKPCLNKEISVTDPTGRVWIHADHFSGNKIDIRHLPAGIYFLSCSNGAAVCVRKFVVER
jgi:hypothetical protein